MKTKFWKIRHKPSGLYFKPSRYASPSNLSKKGKTYNRIPNKIYLGKFYNHPDDINGYTRPEKSRKVVLDEWEIVEYKCEEAKTINLT